MSAFELPCNGWAALVEATRATPRFQATQPTHTNDSHRLGALVLAVKAGRQHAATAPIPPHYPKPRRKSSLEFAAAWHIALSPLTTLDSLTHFHLRCEPFGCYIYVFSGWDLNMVETRSPGVSLPEPLKPQMPTIQHAFSISSRRFQKRARVAVVLALFFIGVSTFVSAFHLQSPYFLLLAYRVNLVTTIASGLFLAAGGIRLYRIFRGPERIWFGSRALAERTLSLSWRYAVAGAPFAMPGAGQDDTDLRFHQELNNAADEATEGGIHYSKPRGIKDIDVITEWMRQTRIKSLPDRCKIYAEQRIRDQEHWYAKREAENSRAATFSHWMLFAIEILGAALAALNALALLNLDLVGVAGAIAAGVAAWVQFNQFTELASAYGAMAYRMASYRDRCLNNAMPWTNERWAAFVGEVEDTLREENGSWRRIVQQGATNNP